MFSVISVQGNPDQDGSEETPTDFNGTLFQINPLVGRDLFKKHNGKNYEPKFVYIVWDQVFGDSLVFGS